MEDNIQSFLKEKLNKIQEESEIHDSMMDRNPYSNLNQFLVLPRFDKSSAKRRNISHSKSIINSVTIS